MGEGGVDPSISYTAADGAWAEWIAWHLEDDGDSSLIPIRCAADPNPPLAVLLAALLAGGAGESRCPRPTDSNRPRLKTWRRG
jgi:hypothetical protein